MKQELEQNGLEWLVVFLVYNNSTYDIENIASDYVKMEIQKNSLLNAIEDSLFSEKIKIITIEAKIKKIKKEIVQVIHVLEKGEEKLIPVNKISGFNISALSNEKEVTAILQYVVNKYPSKRNMVVTFGHGSIFGINFLPTVQKIQFVKDKTGALAKIKEQKRRRAQSGAALRPLKIKAYNSPDNRFLPAQANTSTESTLTEISGQRNDAINLLTVKELNGAITNVYGTKKLDILVMYNCLMQNVFTQYELRNSVGYLVAPVSGISYPSYNYREVFKAMSENLQLTTREIADLFLMKLNTTDRKKTHLPFLPEINHTWKIHSVHLDETVFDNVKAKFDTLIKEAFILSLTVPDVLYCLKVTARQMFNYAEYCLSEVKIIDLTIFLNYWLSTITQYQANTPLIPHIKSFREALNNVIVTKEFVGNEFFKSEDYFIDKDFSDPGTQTGICIWFPHRKFDKEQEQLFFEILHPNNAVSFIPSFIDNTEYAALFNKYIERFG